MRAAILFVMLVSPSWAAITRTGNYSPICIGASPLSCNAPTSPTVGNIIVVGVYGAGTQSVADNATGGTNSYSVPTGATSGVLSQFVATIARTNAGTFTITATISACIATCTIWFGEYHGVDATQIDLATGTTAGSGGVRQCDTTTATSNANDLLVATLTNSNLTPAMTPWSGNTVPPPAWVMSSEGTPGGYNRAGIMDTIAASVLTSSDVRFSVGAGGGVSLCVLVAYKATVAASTIQHRVTQ